MQINFSAEQFLKVSILHAVQVLIVQYTVTNGESYELRINAKCVLCPSRCSKALYVQWEAWIMYTH